jgi:4-diphosphocytidyl-2-C-methyl-D-erythritol kinase
MRVRAFAKINLSLRVLGARASGYHELRTIFQSIALHDTLTIRAARGPFRLTCDDPNCPSDSTNLIWRAAERLWKAAGRRGAPRDIAVDLEKRIPLEAGLGGGSSDAAAALRVLSRLWRVDASEVRAVAAELGADVPYFFEGGTVLGLERGDRLFPLIDYPAAWVGILLPGFGVSTREAFGWWDSDKARRTGRAGRAIGEGGLRGFRSQCEFVNDLEASVAAHHPSIRRAVSALKKAGATHAAMSGSGSAVFGLFTRRSDAAGAVAALASRARRALMTRTLNRSKYQVLAAA